MEEKMKQESKTEIMRTAHRFRFSTDIGSSGRTWLKAASVFIWNYIIPSLHTKHQTDETLLKLIEQLLQYFHIFYKRNQTAVSSRIPLPTRKVFLSLARLRRRLSGKYTRSRLIFEDFVGRSTSSMTTTDDWGRNPYLLIGYLRFRKVDDDEECLVICDGSDDYLLCSFHCSVSPFIDSVVLLTAWNFIPSTHHEPGYIEILEDPVVLSGFNTTITHHSNRISPTLRSEILSKLDNSQTSCDDDGTYFGGRIQEVISRQVGIFALTSRHVIMCTTEPSLQSTLGLRRGCVVAVKAEQVVPHPYNPGQTLLITTDPPQVIRHSDLTTPWSPFFTSSTTTLTQLRLTKPHRCVKVWQLASDISKLCHGGCITTTPTTTAPLDQALSSVCFNAILGADVGKFYDTFDRLLLSDIRDRALHLARDRLPRPPTPEYWSFTTANYTDIYPSAALLIGALRTDPTSGELVMTDTSGSIPCVLVTGEYNSKPTTHQQMNPPCTTGLDKLVSISNFLLVVERKWNRPTVVMTKQLSASDVIARGDDMDPYHYDVYMVAFASDLTVLCEHNDDNMTCDFNPLFNRFMTSQAGNSTTTESILTSDVSMLRTDCVLFVLSNTAVAQHQHNSCNFNLICWKVPTSGTSLGEIVLTMRGKSRRWRGVLQPGSLVRLTNAAFSSLVHDEKVYQVDDCDVTHLHDVSAVVDVMGEEHVAILERISAKWARSKWNDNMRHMYVTDELRRGIGGLNVINVCGLVRNRSTFADGCFGKIKTRVELAVSSGGRTHCVYLDALPLPEGMAVIPGCTVAFYRLKASVSKMGHVYTKYTKNSHHKIVGIPRTNAPVPTTVADEVDDVHHDDVTTPEELLYNISLQPNNSNQLVKIRVTLLNIVELKLRLKSTRTGEVLFTAKCAIHDHTGRALLHFDESKLPDFRRLTRISDAVWGEVTSLLHLTTDRGVDFTFYRTEPPFYGGAGVNASVMTILYRMFAAVNDVVCLDDCVMLAMRRTSSVVGAVGGKHMDLMKSFHDSNPMCRIEATSYDDDCIPTYGLSVHPLEFSCVRAITD